MSSINPEASRFKVVFITSDPKKKLSARLTQYFTGSPIYHVGIVDSHTNLFYDMSWKTRVTTWPKYWKHTQGVISLDAPKLELEHILVAQANNENSRYSGLDYIFKGIEGLLNRTKYLARFFYHLVGKNTVNFNGKICTEYTREALVLAGYTIPELVPTPFSLYNHLHHVLKLKETDASFIKLL